MKGFMNSDNKDSGNNKKFAFINELDKNYYQAINLQNSGQLKQALKIYDYLIKNSYIREEVFLNYANICQQLNENDKAIILYKKSININPNNFIPFFKMGFILNNNGRYFEAYPFAKKAIEIQPNLWQGYHNLIKYLEI